MQFNNSQLRRQDRLLDEKRAFQLLKEGTYGILSMQDENGEGAYGIPVNYVWDHGNSIYIHCAPVGRKLRCMDACNKVSFCVVGHTEVRPDQFTTAYESVVLRCSAYRKNFLRTEIVRLDIEEISAKTNPIFTAGAHGTESR